MGKPVVIGRPVVSPVLFIGQAPGDKEPVMGKPFAWTAGRNLFKWFGTLGVDEETFRDNVYMAAVCRCFPGKNPKGGDRVPLRRRNRQLRARGSSASSPSAAPTSSSRSASSPSPASCEDAPLRRDHRQEAHVEARRPRDRRSSRFRTRRARRPGTTSSPARASRAKRSPSSASTRRGPRSREASRTGRARRVVVGELARVLEPHPLRRRAHGLGLLQHAPKVARISLPPRHPPILQPSHPAVHLSQADGAHLDSERRVLLRGVEECSPRRGDANDELECGDVPRAGAKRRARVARDVRAKGPFARRRS